MEVSLSRIWGHVAHSGEKTPDQVSSGLPPYSYIWRLGLEDAARRPSSQGTPEVSRGTSNPTLYCPVHRSYCSKGQRIILT